MRISKHASERMTERLGYTLSSTMLESTLRLSRRIAQRGKSTVMYACKEHRCMFIVNESTNTVVSFWVCGTRRLMQYLGESYSGYGV